MSTTEILASSTSEAPSGSALDDPSARIVVCDLHKTFTMHQQGGTRLAVLADAELRVDAGECLALTGPSGAGKSTLLRCLFGNYGPTSGQVWVRHYVTWVDVASATPSRVLDVRCHSIGWVSQFLRVIPRVPTISVVAEPILAQGRSRDEALTRASELLRRLNVPERLWRLAPATFSGGEQQRVNVARGLAAAHPILLVDEPTASLDTANRDVVVELLNEARFHGAAIVGIFHDGDVRARVSTRTLNVAALMPAQCDPQDGESIDADQNGRDECRPPTR